MRLVKATVFLIGLAPLGLLLWQALFGDLGANPAEAIIRGNGDWALRLLLATLALAPLAQLTGRQALLRLRRLLGLLAFFYAGLHLVAYLVLEQSLDSAALLADLVERPFISVGMLTFLLLVPLAVTSTGAMVRRLGARRWQGLHRLVYPAAVGALLHFYLMVKADTREVLLYALVLALLLAQRTVLAWGRRRARALPGASDCL